MVLNFSQSRIGRGLTEDQLALLEISKTRHETFMTGLKLPVSIPWVELHEPRFSRHKIAVRERSHVLQA